VFPAAAALAWLAAARPARGPAAPRPTARPNRPKAAADLETVAHASPRYQGVFGTYKRACQRADALLFTAGDAAAIDAACCRSPLGKLLPNALYVHRCALDRLEPILRVYEGCARAYLGEIEGANVLKLHRFSGKISYLFYPAFDTEAHLALLRSLKLSLRTLDLDCYDYATAENPPVLHRKESFLPSDYPAYDAFAELIRREEEAGLLENAATIGTRNGWQDRLHEAGMRIEGHQLLRS
jgi:DNA phosphorothioation-associated putative methyltransferase